MLKVHPKHAMKGPGGGSCKAVAILDPGAYKGMSGTRHALPPGKRPGNHGKGGWVGPTAKNNVRLTKYGTYRGNGK